MSDKNMKIELLYFDDCPSWLNAQEILFETLKKLELPQSVDLVAVETQEDAIRHKFTGSPMIRVNGEDLFPTGQKNYALGCRVYQTPAGYMGWPTEEMVLQKLQPMIEQD